MSSIASPPKPAFRRQRLAARRLVGPLMASPVWARLRDSTGRAGVEEPVRRMAAISREHGIPPLLTVAVALVETGLRNTDTYGSPGRGWFQMRIHDLPYRTSERPPTLAEARDLDFATREFCRAAAREAELVPELQRDLAAWAEKTQGVGWHLHRNEPYVPVNFVAYLHETAGLLRVFDR